MQRPVHIFLTKEVKSQNIGVSSLKQAFDSDVVSGKLFYALGVFLTVRRSYPVIRSPFISHVTGNAAYSYFMLWFFVSIQ